MKNLRNTQNLRGFQHGSREQREALRVIRLVARNRAIKGIAIKVLRTVDKVKAHSRLTCARHHRCEAVLIIEWNRNAAYDCRRLRELRLPVTSQILASLMPEGGQRALQCSDNAAQPSGLRKRDAF